MTHQTTSFDYNDAHMTGACYINNIRIVETRGGKSYLSLSLSVLQGRKDNPEYLRIRSANATGSQAKAMTEKLHALWLLLPDKEVPEGQKYAPSKAKIFARFKIGDLQATAFMGSDGEPKPSLQARLLKLTHIYIDGERLSRSWIRSIPHPASGSDNGLGHNPA